MKRDSPAAGGAATDDILTRAEQALSSHESPLPHAADLYTYELIHPGFAERVFRMAELEQQHRHHVEVTMVKQSFRLAARGQLLGFSAALAVLAFGGWVAAQGHAALAAVLVTFDMAGIAAVFVGGRHAMLREFSDVGGPA